MKEIGIELYTMYIFYGNIRKSPSDVTEYLDEEKLS